MKTIRFGIIGLGLMGREFASAAARWCHLLRMDAQPQIVAICGRPVTAEDAAWFTGHFATIKQVDEDYRKLLANPEVEAVYCAVPHHLHQEIYCATIRAGKHLLAEKPFGIDLAANEVILTCRHEHPNVFVRCSSEFPFFPAVQRIFRLVESGAFGRIIEVDGRFQHSSDLDPKKPINWKRRAETNGEYGVMGDLGMHVCHVPFRAGWIPQNVRAVLSKIVSERPDGKGGMVPCTTWDNATLLCEATDAPAGTRFPLTLRMQRIAPGEKNTWAIEILGVRTSARFSTKNPKELQVLEYSGGEQTWQHLDVGYEPAFAAVTGPIFEFGFSDAVQQMVAAFLHELAHGQTPFPGAGCVTPEEAALSHRLFTAALKSQRTGATVSV